MPEPLVVHWLPPELVADKTPLPSIDKFVPTFIPPKTEALAIGKVYEPPVVAAQLAKPLASEVKT